jgi:DNA-directed RNA polymerase specialized sigma24 family protein
VSDLLDEVATRAWKGYAQRPRDVSMDQWLVRLLHEVLDEYQAEPAAESLYERIPPDDARYHVDGGWLAENEPFFEPQTPLTLYETLPDHELPEPWQEVAAEEQRQWVLNQLRRLPRRMRRAFTLHVLEGWDEADIAMLQGRSVDEVRQDIQTAPPDAATEPGVGRREGAGPRSLKCLEQMVDRRAAPVCAGPSTGWMPAPPRSRERSCCRSRIPCRPAAFRWSTGC